MSDRTPEIVIAGVIRIDPARRDTALAAARAMMRETRREAGCISYAFSADLDEPGTFHLFEEWESQAALDAHFASPHMARFQQAVGGLGVREMAIRKYAIASAGAL